MRMFKRKERNVGLDFKNRMEIISKKAKAENLTLPYNVLKYIASQVEGNRKDVEGALLQVVSYSVLLNRDIDLNLSKQAIPERIEKTRISTNIMNFPRQFSQYMSRGAAVAAVGSILMVSGCSSNHKEVIAASAPAATAADQNAQSQSQSDVSLNGHAEPYQQVTIPYPASGNIQNLLVHLGDYVQQGQKIAQIDSTDLAYKVKQAESAMKKSQVDAQMQSIQQQISLTQAKVSLSTGGNPVGDVEEAKAKVQDLEVALADAEKNLEKVKNQDNQPQDQETAQAATQMDQLQKQLNSAKQDVQTLSAKADQQRQQAEQQMQQYSLSPGKVYVPPVDPTTAADLDAAKSKESQLEFAMAGAQKNLEAIKNRQAQKAAREQELAQATAARDQAEKQLNAAKQMVEALSAKGDKEKLTADETAQLQQQLNQASSSLATMSVQQSQADLDMLQFQAQNLDVLAPISGFITEPSLSSNGGSGSSSGSGSKGSSSGLNSNSAALFTIANLDQVYVKVDAPESMIGKLKLNQKATVTFPAIGKSMEGTVTYIGEMADMTTMTYPVRILVDNKDHLIRGGMRAQATINN
jgi:multidrug efflux pump subunit AcrA (membrane-fusion protein)